MSSHSICFRREIRKISILLNWKKKLSKPMIIKTRGVPCTAIALKVSCVMVGIMSKNDNCYKVDYITLKDIAVKGHRGIGLRRT